MSGTSVPTAVLVLLPGARLVAQIRVHAGDVEYACTVVGAQALVRAEEDGEDVAGFLTVVATVAVAIGDQGGLRVFVQAR